MVLSSDVTRVLGGCRLLLQPLHVLTAPSTLTFGKQFTIYGQLWHFREERGRMPEVAWSSRFAKTKPDKHIDIGVTWFSGWTRQSGSRGPPNRHRTPRLLLPSHCWSPWMLSGLRLIPRVWKICQYATRWYISEIERTPPDFFFATRFPLFLTFFNCYIWKMLVSKRIKRICCLGDWCWKKLNRKLHQKPKKKNN